MVAGLVVYPAVGGALAISVPTTDELRRNAIADNAFGPLRVPDVVVKRDPFVPQVQPLPSGTFVVAVILGITPRALLELGRQTRIVGLGDSVAGCRVIGIDEGGILLSDGNRLPVRAERP